MTKARSLANRADDFVSVMDYGADPTGVADSTAAFTAAQTAALASNSKINIPGGTFLLGTTVPFFQQNGAYFEGAGKTSTWIKQGNAGIPAWMILSGTSTINGAWVYNTQITGVELIGVGFKGATSATVAALVMEAHTPYVVCYSEVDIYATGCFNSIKMICGAAYETYSNKISVVQDQNFGTVGLGAIEVGVRLAGVYNEYYLNLAYSNSGVAISSTDWNAVFHHCVTDSCQNIQGDYNTLICPTVESWTGTVSANNAINLIGYSNVIINGSVVNVPHASCPQAIGFNGGGGGLNTILGFQVIGTAPATAPRYPLAIPPGNTGFIANFQNASSAYYLESYVSAAILSGFTFVASPTLTKNGNNATTKLPPVTVTTATYTLDTTIATDYTVLLNYAGTVTLTLPAAASFTGREIVIQNTLAQSAISASSNVVPANSTSAGTAILPAVAGAWARLQSNGTNWNVIGNSLNTLAIPGLTSTGPITVAGASLDVSVAGYGVRVAEGSNAKQGTQALSSGSAVVANTNVTATSRIFLTSQADGGTPGWLRVSARTPGTSFTITSSSGTDTSTVAYEIFEVG